MENNDLVSVVLTSFNQYKLLERAFDSIINQTYEHIEIIIVDDCSTEIETINYLEKLQSFNYKNILIHVQEQNVGVTKNKNTGFKLASGKYISYLDGDDYYFSTKIEKELEFLKSNSNFDIVYSNFYIEDEHTGEIDLWGTDKNLLYTGDIFKEVICRAFPRNTLFRFEMLKREVLKNINYYDENLLAYEDWDSRIRYSKLYKIGYVDNIGATYFTNEEGISRRFNEAQHFLQQEIVYLKNLRLIDSPRLLRSININLANNLLICRNKVFKNNKLGSIKNLVKQFYLSKTFSFKYFFKVLFNSEYRA